jgi:KUP system potassium uptake protein
MVFFHLHPIETPTVLNDRYVISRLGSIPGCYRLVVRHGFMDEVITPDLAALIYEQIRKFVVRQAGTTAESDERLGDRLSPEARSTGTDFGEETESQIQRPAATAADLTSQDSGSATPIESAPEEYNEKGKQRFRGGGGAAELSDAKVRQELARLDRAFACKVMYIVGKEQMKIKMGASLFRRLVLETFLFIRDNTRAKIANLRLAMDRVVEVGFVKDI